MNRFVIITSINPPTEAVKKFALSKDNQVVIVGDRKTPPSWQSDNVIYLSIEGQQKLRFNVLNGLPFNSYNRKIIGYLYAIRNGADVIVDSDDDNIPKDDWGYPEFEGTYRFVGDGLGFQNIYNYFTLDAIWPRGFPLQHVTNPVSRVFSYQDKQVKVGVWEGLVNGDPDVDAIFRLTRGESSRPHYYDDGVPVVLGAQTLCPFNSQNTVFRKELFPLLYLPSFCGGRANDIFRGLIAQHVMWLYGYRLGFTPATVYQIRNPHNYLGDFKQEITCYLYSEKVSDLAREAVDTSCSLPENLVNCYSALVSAGITKPKEIELLNNWLKDLKEVGYEFIH